MGGEVMIDLRQKIWTLDKGMAPQVLTTPGPGPQKRGNTVDTGRVQ